jgi:hypothetical protein
VEPSSSYNQTGPVLQFLDLELTGITKNTQAVIRIDLKVTCDIDCDCHCLQDPEEGSWGALCASVSYVRKDNINTATKKRDIISDWCNAINRDVYALSMFFFDFEVNGDFYLVPLVSVDFINICRIMDCSDLSGCWNFYLPEQIGGYANRSCNWSPVPCDDGDDCTIDQCLPPFGSPNDPSPPPNCIHIDSCGSDEITGYCYNYNHNSWNCSFKCNSDSDCAIPGQEEDIFCYFIDEGYCKSGDGESYNCYSDENGSLDCSKSCTDTFRETDCDEGYRCISTIQCSSKFQPFLMQQENSQLDESLNQQRMTGDGLSAVQLGAIIGGCVGFVGILMLVFFIIKRSHQQKFNSEIFETLQSPLNQ